MLNSPSPENLLYDSQSSLSSITSALIDKCRNNNKAAWNLFFHHSIPFIYKHIIISLLRYKRKDLAADDDVIQDIFGTIATTLTTGSTIHKLKNPESLEPWLKVIISSKVTDYLRAGNRQKNISKTLGIQKTTALDAPIKDGSNTTWHESIFDPEKEQDITEILDKHYEKAKKPEKDKASKDKRFGKQQPNLSSNSWDHVREWIGGLTIEQKWLIRLKGIFEIPLSQEEITSLANFSRVEETALAGEIDKTMDRLEGKQQKKLQAENNAGKLWWVIIDLEKQLQKERRGSDAYGKLEDEIANKTKTFKKHLLKSQVSLVPETREIAKLLNLIPRASTGRLNTMSNRLKNKFQSLF
jgi:DNA-directed RNA polymerase specialized sigma24 family protein